MKKGQSGFGALETILIIVIVVLLGAVGWFVYNNHHKTTTASVATTAKTTTTTPAKTPTPQTVTPNETITGMAVLSSVASEGLSIQYTQTDGTYTYHPIQALQDTIDSNTTITNKAGIKIQFNDIKAGDSLVVELYHAPCVAGISGGGGGGGCRVTIYSIQDLSI